ncbi:YbcC family protein [Halocola ammonii]
MTNTSIPEFIKKESVQTESEKLVTIMSVVCKKIAPLWPLENFVAVNPFMGQTDKKFEEVARQMSQTSGAQMTLPLSFYLQKLEEGKIFAADIAAALEERSLKVGVRTVINKARQMAPEEEQFGQVETFSDVASRVTGKQWSRHLISRVSFWAAAYFDDGQANWSASFKKMDLFSAWKTEASIDRSPEIAGLKGFREFVKELPDSPLEAVSVSLRELGVPNQGLENYLQRNLMRLSGWAGHVSYLDWENGVYGEKNARLLDFLAVLVSWEYCLFKSLKNQRLEDEWYWACQELSQKIPTKDLDNPLNLRLIFQDAFDIASQRDMIDMFETKTPSKRRNDSRKKAQAVFCIDVRSEVLRRNIESIDDKIETLGFAGFFGFPVSFKSLGESEGKAQCPVLIKPKLTVPESLGKTVDVESVEHRKITSHKFLNVIKNFRSSAVSCFSFVSPLGLTYLAKLFTDAFGITRTVPEKSTYGLDKKMAQKRTVDLSTTSKDGLQLGIDVDQQVELAKNAISAMSLKEDFARLVLIVGHGASTVNNPYASGLDCGACGGRSGEPNAKVAAAVLNNVEVRNRLREFEIEIPKDTVFVACLHDTTTDEVKVFNEDQLPEEQRSELRDVKKSLSQAGALTRADRSLRMANLDPKKADKSIIGRSKDWSQVRPEWGLAGCSGFIVASRERSKHLNLNSNYFLHSYEWKKDRDFSILEVIMTAPMVVTNWINMQYFASTVDNQKFGSGNKTLHNVTSGIGVLEGYSGDLRVGLPQQSVHDGEKLQHEPVRLMTVIEAPIAAINGVLRRHESINNLCENGWINLFAMDSEGKVSSRYVGQLEWEQIED